MNTQKSIVSNYVLQSFNLLDSAVAQDLNNIIKYLIDIRKDSDKLADHITVQTSMKTNESTYKQEKSELKIYEKIAGTIGISGSYGFYSGSLKVDASNSKYQTSSSFNASCTGTINVGNVYFNQSISEIINFIDTDVITALKEINDLKKAEAFIQNYGTHIAKGWNLGGAFSLDIQSYGESYEDETKVKVQVEAAYKSVSSVNASASAAYELNQSGVAENLSITKDISGGSAIAAGGIDLKKPDTGIDKWIESIDSNSTYGLYESISFAELAKAIDLLDAANFLNDYVNLFILKHSLEYPTIFTDYTKCVAYTPTTVNVSGDKDFKIVSGGAKITKEGNTWLLSTYPKLDNQNEINGWTSTSHDAFEPSSEEYITSYAIGVYDPGNFLDVKVNQKQGTNTQAGGDTASATITDDYYLVGGGCSSEANGGNLKYMVSSYPEDDYRWTSTNHDYNSPASNVVLTSYAVGIKSDQLAINRNVVHQKTPAPVSHGNEKATLGNGVNVIGGGIFVNGPGGMGSLAKQSFPSTKNSWTEFNADLHGNVDKRLAEAYAIGLEVKIKGL
ncbi:MAC/perforin domain-containing protein [Flammeovirga sp. SJP92]|uniref:MAC/perforin domain-containing protein n=1 Tax=Flammeovirga sp. SJP92 TaxID=1775430 RepID=UPI000788106A|nr:MAC/perforin domain-containing protein [Flammeovirga sp. SJP92]KXX69806.1 hypothetical protein AVL50_13025 [Flammeovirga sp. SJP92]